MIHRPLSHLIALLLLAPSLALSQDAATVLAGISRALGTTGLDTLLYSGQGYDFAFGQAYRPDVPWPKFVVRSYTRSIDFRVAAVRDQRVRRQFEDPPRGGGLQPVVGERIQDQTTIAMGATPWAQQLDLWMTPQGFVKAAGNAKVTLSQRQLDGRKFTVLSYIGGNGAPVDAYVNDSNLIEQVQTRVDNPVLGDMPVVAKYADYRDFAGVQFPTRIVLLQGGHPTLDVTITDVRPNAAVDIPRAMPAAVEVPDAMAPLPTERLADGIHLILGAGTVSVAFDFGTYSVVMEAPGDEQRAAAVIAATRRLFPGKPIRYVINTHQHFDHAGGLRSFVAESATIVTQQVNKAYFERVFAAPHTLNPSLDARQRAALRVKVLPVADKLVLSGGGQRIELYHLRGNMHNAGLLMAYLPSQKMLIQADMWGPSAPGAAPAPVTTYTQNFLDNLDRLHLDIERIVPIHYPTDGRSSTMADLLRSVGRSP